MGVRDCHNHVSETVVTRPTEEERGGGQVQGPLAPRAAGLGSGRDSPCDSSTPQPPRRTFCPPARPPSALGRRAGSRPVGPAGLDGADGVHGRWGRRGLGCRACRGQRADLSLQRGELRARPACRSAGEQRGPPPEKLRPQSGESSRNVHRVVSRHCRGCLRPRTLPNQGPLYHPTVALLWLTGWPPQALRSGQGPWAQGRMPSSPLEMGTRDFRAQGHPTPGERRDVEIPVSSLPIRRQAL